MSAASDDETEDEFFDAEDHFADQVCSNFLKLQLHRIDALLYLTGLILCSTTFSTAIFHEISALFSLSMSRLL